MKTHLIALTPLALVALLWTAQVRPTSDAPIIAVDWQAREPKDLREKVDKVLVKYVQELKSDAYSTKGGRTLQALGLAAALPRLPIDQREETLKKAITLVKAEGKAFWPDDDADATARTAGLHGSASYHLPLILLLLEYRQAGAFRVDDGTGGARDREMRFGILPAPPDRKNIVRLLTLLLASGYNNANDNTAAVFDGAMQEGLVWSYGSFACHANSCLSPTGMAAIGLSAAVFGLNVLAYEPQEYEIKFNGVPLARKDIRDRLIDVCAHLIFSLVQHNLDSATALDKLKPDISQLDAGAFREITAPGLNGVTLSRLQAERADLKATPGNLAVYYYQKKEHHGAYYSACAAYTLTTAARILAFALEREAKDGQPVGHWYPFQRENDGRWRLSVFGGWSVEILPEGSRRFSPLRFSQGGTSLDIDGTITGALNVCVACMTEERQGRRRLRGGAGLTPGAWSKGSSSAASNLDQFAALHAFALYKAAVVTGDGYSIGRWRVWEDLAEGLSREAFVEPQIKAQTVPERKAAALAFSIMTMTRTYRPIFPKSDR